MSLMDNSNHLEEADLISRLLDAGEGLEIEYKRCRDLPHDDTFETICSFANRQGGHILLGVADDGTVEGVNASRVREICRNVANRLNNPNYFNIPPSVNPIVSTYQGHTVIRLWIPVGSVVHSIKGIVYDRTADADIQVRTDQQLAALYMRKQEYFSEQRVYPYLSKSDLNLDLLMRVRRMALARQPHHRWGELSDDELLRSASLYRKDFITGEEGYTLAAALLLGTDDVILSLLPTYGTDAYVQIEDTDRYDDRLIVRHNLIESYDELLRFMQKHLPDRFYLDGVENKSLRDVILREVISNTLMHREYTNPIPATMVIKEDSLIVENASRPAFIGDIDPNSFNPLPKNPVIGRFFMNIGLADSLGSGTRNLYKYSRLYGGGDPELTEGNVFRTYIPLQPISASNLQMSVDEAISYLLRTNDSTTLQEVANLAHVTPRTARRHMDNFLANGKAIATGSRKDRRYARK